MPTKSTQIKVSESTDIAIEEYILLQRKNGIRLNKKDLVDKAVMDFLGKSTINQVTESTTTLSPQPIVDLTPESFGYEPQPEPVITYLNSALYNAALSAGHSKSEADNYVFRFEQNLQRMKTNRGTIDENEIKELFESIKSEIRSEAN